MTSTLCPEYDMAQHLSTEMPPSQLARRTSRSSCSQSTHRSSRVEKPRSNHNSPRNLERRKTTTGTKRYATLDDHFNFMYGFTGEEEAQEAQKASARPMSWHPSSQGNGTSQPPMLSVQTSGQDWSRHSTHGSDFYSLSAQSPMYPMEHSYPGYASGVHRGSQASDNSWSTQQTQYTMSAYSTPMTENMPWYLSEWARKNEAGTQTSRNGSTDFLPIQHPSANDSNSNEDEEMEDTGKELLGLGLYDQPETSLSWNSSFLLEGTGKGLKLEETWQPPEEDEDDDAEGDASSDDGSIEELPTANEEIQLPIPNTKSQLPNSMDGQSFFFEEDDSCANEWWYQQLRQPSVPARDAGFGKGWL